MALYISRRIGSKRMIYIPVWQSIDLVLEDLLEVRGGFVPIAPRRVANVVPDVHPPGSGRSGARPGDIRPLRPQRLLSVRGAAKVHCGNLEGVYRAGDQTCRTQFSLRNGTLAESSLDSPFPRLLRQPSTSWFHGSAGRNLPAHS